MNQEQFCRSVYEQAVQGAVAAEVQTLEHPPGRDPSRTLREMSKWYLGLTPEDRRLAVELMRWGAEAGVFGVLAILDGARPVWGAEGDLVNFELYAENGERVLLNNPALEMLHDIFTDVAQRDR